MKDFLDDTDDLDINTPQSNGLGEDTTISPQINLDDIDFSILDEDLDAISVDSAEDEPETSIEEPITPVMDIAPEEEVEAPQVVNEVEMVESAIPVAEEVPATVDSRDNANGFPKQVVMANQNIEPTEGDYVSFPKPYKRRTKENGIVRKSGFGGSAARYALMSIWYGFLGFISLGLLAPIGFVNKKKYIINRTYVNGRKLAFMGRYCEIYFKYIFSVILCCLTFGLYQYKMRTILEAWLTENTYFEDTEGQLNIAPSVYTGTASEYFGVLFKAVFFSIITLGLLIPVARLWVKKYFVENRYINGRQLKFNVSYGKFYGFHIGWFFVSIITLVGAFLCPIAERKYLYRKLDYGKELFNDDSVLNDGMTKDDVDALSDVNFDIAEYARVTAKMTGKSIETVATQLKPRVKWARANAKSLQLQRIEKKYKKNSKKFKRVGSAFIVGYLVLASIIGVIFGGLYAYENYRPEIAEAVNKVITQIGMEPIDPDKLPSLADLADKIKNGTGDNAGGGESIPQDNQQQATAYNYNLPDSIALDETHVLVLHDVK